MVDISSSLPQTLSMLKYNVSLGYVTTEIRCNENTLDGLLQEAMNDFEIENISKTQYRGVPIKIKHDMKDGIIEVISELKQI